MQMTCGCIYDEEFGEFPATTEKSENFFSTSSLFQKCTRFELQKYRGVNFHDTEQWCKIWINPDLQKMAWRTWWTFIRALKNLKNCTLMGSFCPKRKWFSEKIWWVLCVITLKGGAKSKGKLTYGLKNDDIKIFEEFSCEQKVWKFPL